MNFKKCWFAFLIVFLGLNLISYELFSFYNKLYKKVDITLYFPYFEPEQSGIFLESLFKENLGQIKETSKNCVIMSLIENGNQNIDFTEPSNISNYVHNKIKNALPVEIDAKNFKLEEKRCPFTIFDSYANRRNYLFYIGIFNLFAAYMLVFSFFELRKNRQDA